MANHMTVKLHIYDITKGMAKQLSMMMLGKQINGVWHTGVVVYGKEYFFGGTGIQYCHPCDTELGQPDSIVQLGNTVMPESEFNDFLRNLAADEFNAAKYHLLKHNCNSFSNRICQLLVQKSIPSHITNLPSEVMSTPFGKMLEPVIESMSVAPQGGISIADKGNATPGQSSNSPLISVKLPLDLFIEQKDEIKSKLDSNSFELLEEAYKYASQESNSTQWSIGRFHLRAIISAIVKVEDSKQRMGICSLLTNCLNSEEIVEVLLNDPKEPMKELFALEDPSFLLHPLINATSSASLSDKVKGKYGKECRKIIVDGLLENFDCTTLASKLAYNVMHSSLDADVSEYALEFGSALLENILVSQSIESTNDEDCLIILQALDKAIDESTAVIDLAAAYELDDYLKAFCDKRKHKGIAETGNLILAKLLSVS